jgi:hypothetical protein
MNVSVTGMFQNKPARASARLVRKILCTQLTMCSTVTKNYDSTASIPVRNFSAHRDQRLTDDQPPGNRADPDGLGLFAAEQPASRRSDNA